MFVYGRSGFRFWIVGSDVYANDHSWSSQPRSSLIASNVWYYVGVTYDYSSGIAKVWVNGEDVDTVSTPVTMVIVKQLNIKYQLFSLCQ